MTSPEDDGLEETLRRALSDAADEVEPGTDGLDRIRARIDNRPPRPWLFSVLVGFVDRVRHWTWRGHWAWQDSLPRLKAPQERRSRRGNFRGRGFGWVRYVTVLAGIAVLASVALGVQPLRHAILQAGSSLNGGGGPPRASAGTEGNGTQASGGSATPTTATVASGGGQTSQTHTTASGKAVAPQPTSSGRCVSTALPVVTTAKPSETTVATGASSTAPATNVPSSASSSPTVPTEPVYTNSNAPTCPVAAPTRTPSPTPTSSSASPVPTPSDVPPTQTSSPTGTDPTGTDPTATDPAPTASGSSPTGDPPTWSPSDPPTRTWTYRQGRRHADLLEWHHWRR
ncbi:MAG: hypothetical protein ACRDNO_04280 [Trebonia sp.]